MMTRLDSSRNFQDNADKLKLDKSFLFLFLLDSSVSFHVSTSGRDPRFRWTSSPANGYKFLSYFSSTGQTVSEHCVEFRSR